MISRMDPGWVNLEKVVIWKYSCPLGVSNKKPWTSSLRAFILGSLPKAGFCRDCKAHRKDMFYSFQKSAEVSSFQNQGMALLWWVMSLRILRY